MNIDSVFVEVLGFIDTATRPLSPAEYDEFLDQLATHIDACRQARAEDRRAEEARGE